MTDLQSKVRAIFDYNPETGILRRKKTGAQGYKSKEGYIVFYFCGKNHKAHRLIWLYVYGWLPEKPNEIDHVNGCGTDNRLENLRCCTHAKNIYNAKLRRDNAVGVIGVYPYRGGRFAAQLTINKKKSFWDTLTLWRKPRTLERSRPRSIMASLGYDRENYPISSQRNCRLVLRW